MADQSPFDTAIRAAGHALRAVAGVPAEYTRGAVTVELRVVPAEQVGETVDDEGAAVKVKRRDFLLDADELESQGITLPPDRGDVIRIWPNGAALDFEIIGPGGRPPYEWSDPGRSRLRVHTQEI